MVGPAAARHKYILGVDTAPKVVRDLAAGRAPASLSRADISDAISFGLDGLVVQAIDDGVQIAPDAHDLATRARFDLLVNQDILADVARRTFAAMASGGITPCLIKGAATSRTLYEDPLYRAAVDLDVVLGLPPHSDRFDSALEALGMTADIRRAIANLQQNGCDVGGFSIDASQHSLRLDIHFNPFGLLVPLRSAELIGQHFVAGDFDDAAVLVPDTALGLAISAVHFLRDGGSNLKPAADVARMIDPKHREALSGCRDIAESEGIVRLVATGLHTVGSLLDFDAATRAEIQRSFPEPKPLGRFAMRTMMHPQLATFHVEGRQRALRGVSRWYVPSPDMLRVLMPEETSYPLGFAKKQWGRAIGLARGLGSL